MDANSHENFGWVSRSFWSATRLRVALDRAAACHRKRCEDAPHSKSTSCEMPSLIRGLVAADVLREINITPQGLLAGLAS